MGCVAERGERKLNERDSNDTTSLHIATKQRHRLRHRHRHKTDKEERSQGRSRRKGRSVRALHKRHDDDGDL